MTQSAQKLQHFRSKAYQLLRPAKDATFDLMDVVLVTRNMDTILDGFTLKVVVIIGLGLAVLGSDGVSSEQKR